MRTLIDAWCNIFISIWNKNAFQWDAYRTAHLFTGGGCLPRGCLPRGVSARGSVCLGGCACHVTYPIMHLMLPVCCLHTNWDPPTVQLLIYCWLVMWPARHAGIPLPPPPRGQTGTCKRLRAVTKHFYPAANWSTIEIKCFFGQMTE